MKNGKHQYSIDRDAIVYRTRPRLPKKICMISYLADPSYIPNMMHGAHSLQKLGFDIESICASSKAEFLTRPVQNHTFPIRRVFLYSRKFFHDVFGMAGQNVVIAALQYVLTYAEFVVKSALHAWRSRADLYEPHDLPALLPAVLVASLRRKPVVYHAHELYAEMHEKVRFAHFWKFLERVLLRFVDRIIVPEENRALIYFREYHTRKYPLIVRNCPPFMEPAGGTKLRDRLRERGIEFDKIVLYQGLLDASRCIEELTAAMQHVDPRIVLVLLGGGFKEWRTPKEIVRLKNNVIIVPRVPYDEVPGYTASADIGVLFYRNTCRNNYYCAPNKIHEYMMMGLPVITCDYPGIRKIVEQELVGLCVNPESPREIARAINSLAADATGYNAMRANCLRVSRDVYNWEIEARKMSVEYFHLLNMQSGVLPEKSDPVLPHHESAMNIVLEQ